MRMLVTGGGAGLGRAIARRALAGGARVHVFDVDEAAVAALLDAGLAGSVVDVADADHVVRGFDEATTVLGGLDVLVNNAGVAGPTASVEHLDPADVRRTLDVNVVGAVLCAARAVPLLRSAGGGSIVNIASTAGTTGYPLRTPYVASKWALVGLTKTWAMELGEFGIRVNAVSPGPVAGPRMDRVIAAEAAATGRTVEDVEAGYRRQTSMSTFVQPEDVADAVWFLCTSPHISGQVLAVDGHTETLRT